MSFQPDYRNIEAAARNRQSARLPLYEHNISDEFMEQATGVAFRHLANSDLDEYFRHFSGFFRDMGYDTVSFEVCAGAAMPGSGALGGHKKGIIQDRESFEAYPWDKLPDLYWKQATPLFEALRRTMPEGMKAIGGVGNGIFECVQDLVGYMDLCYMSVDDPELYAEMFRKIGDLLVSLWERFLNDFADVYCVCRFGDDLGFKSTTLLSAEDVRAHILPQYKRVVDVVHAAGKPFLLHTCGCIFNVMEDILNTGIDAKHSNEDQIALFPEWVRLYGDRIGNFGGLDTDDICRQSPAVVEERTLRTIEQCVGHGGFAFGSGNSIPNYVNVEAYRAMVNTVRRYRGETL